MKRLLLILFGFCLSLPAYADGWVIIDTVGIVSIEIDADNSVRSNQQLSKVARKVHKVAKKLNKKVIHDHIFHKVHLYETGINGTTGIRGKFNREEKPPQLIGLNIFISAELFKEETVIALYRYAVSIKDQLYYEKINNLFGPTLLKRANIIP